MLNTTAAVVILFWALWCVFCKHVNDGILGKIIYSFAALAAFALLVGQHSTGAAVDPSAALNWAMAMLGARQMAVRYVWPLLRRHFVFCERCKNRRVGDL